MSDTLNSEAPKPQTFMVVPVTKSKGTVTIDTSILPDEVYAEALLQGLKVLVNRGMSKITKSSTKDEAELKSLSQDQAEKNVEAMLAGKIKFSAGVKAKKASGKVMTEAMRLARGIVKDEIKKSGGKVSHYEASEITKAAKAYLEADPTIIEMAEANLKAREETPKPTTINLAELIKASPKLVAAAEAKKKDKPLSAKQAGMTGKRSKAKPSAEATH